MVDPNVVGPQVIEFLAGIATGYLTKEGEDILEKSTDKIFESLKKKLGKDEFEKIKGMETPEAKNALEALIKNKHLRKEVHAFYVIYKYLEKFTEDSQFLRVMDFRRGEGIPLDRIYMKLQIIEEQKKKDQLAASKYYDEDYYYQAREKWMRSEEHSGKISPDEIMALGKGVVCILGLPGAGKTTLCKYFCWKSLKGEYAKHRFPIYIELRGIEKDEDPVTYALYSKLKEHFTKEEIKEAVATIKHNTDIFSPLYIFDGLDEVEVEHGKISESIRNCADSSLCIVTSRRSGFIYLQHDKTYEILSLGGDEKEEFVRNYFTQIEEVDRIESFLHVLEKREYDSLSKNPLLLSILCALASDTEDVRTLPSRRSGLYKKIVVKMNEWHKSKGGEELSQEETRALEDMALSLFLKKRPRILFEKGIDENMRKKAAKVGLIYRWDELRYSFLHLTLQEYFAARSLRSLKEKWREIVREKRDIVSWHEIFQLFASILSEEEEYGELKELFSLVLESPDILHLNYALAGHCLAEIDMDDVDWSDEVFGRVFHELERNICNHLFLEAFIHLGERAVDPLLELLQETDDDDLKRKILDALGRIGDPRAVEPLLDLLQETNDFFLKCHIFDALGSIGDSRAVDSLLDLLHETDDNDLKSNISYALGRTGDPRVVDLLLDLLQKTDEDFVRWKISDILGRIGDPRVVDLLLDLLQKTDNNDPKRGISDALGRIGDPRAVEPLLDLLRTDDNGLKSKISDALGRIGDPRAVEPLLDLLQETNDDDLKLDISDALGSIGDPRAVDLLLDLLEKANDGELEWGILHALGSMGDPRAVGPLLDLLQETNDDGLKLDISDALEMIGDSRAVGPLMDLLEKTDDNDLKSKISYSLAVIGDSRAVKPLLDLLQKTDDNDLKSSVSDALGMMEDSRAVKPLLDLLQKTDDNHLESIILDTLGRIGDPRAVEPLMDLLQETNDNHLESMILDTLGRIGDPRAVEPLMDLLKKDDNDLKWRISNALGNINPLCFYPFIENRVVQPIILDILCRISTRFNVRFFEDRIVLPEGDILHIKTEAQRKQAIKKLDKILK